jgi:hypothetical protein
MVRVELMDDWSYMGAHVVVELDDGQRLQARADVGVPSHDLVRQEARLREKFLSLTSPTLGDDGAAAVLAALDGLDDLRVRDLVALCRPH